MGDKLEIEIWHVEDGVLVLHRYPQSEAPQYMILRNGFFADPDGAIEYSRGLEHANVDKLHDHLRRLHGVDR